jgi:hypothetical protein
VKFKNTDDCAIYMRAPHGPDEASHLRQMVARVRSFDIVTPDEPADTAEKIIALCKERWELLPDWPRYFGKRSTRSTPYL